LSHRETTGGGYVAVSAKTVFELSRNGDEIALKAVDRLISYVGLGLANLTTILVPDVIAVGGGLIRSSEQFLEKAIGVVKRTCGEVPLEQTSIGRAMLWENLDLIGAAATLIHQSAEGDRSSDERRKLGP
jgi:glucokinase